MKALTAAEEQIMMELWRQEKAFVKDILEALPEPKPAYNTVSTIVRILEKKGFVGFTAYGKSHQYFPLMTEEKYRKGLTNKLISNYFKGSGKNLVSHLLEEKTLDLETLDQLIKELKENEQ